MEKKNMVLLTVIAVATLLVAVVGATFAYFTASITNNFNGTAENGKTNVTAGSVSGATVVGNVDGEAGSFTATDVYPGHKEVAALKVNVTDDAEQPARINITYKPTVNGFADNSIKISVYKSDTAKAIGEGGNYFQCTKKTGVGSGNDDGVTTFYEECTGHTETELGTIVGSARTLTSADTNNTVVIATDSADSTAAGKDTYYYVVVEYVNNTDAAEDSASQNEDFGAQLEGDISVELAA